MMRNKFTMTACTASVIALSSAFATPVATREICEDTLAGGANSCTSDVINQVATSTNPDQVEPVSNSQGFVLSLDGYAVNADAEFEKQANIAKETGEVSVTQARAPLPAARTAQQSSVEEPRSDWFYFATADLTWSKTNIGGISETKSTGRLTGYVDGVTANGFKITASVDTGEEDIRDVFRKLDRKDPASVLSRIDPEDTYPTFGDDSSMVDNTPTSGRFYLRAQKGESFALWGDYRSQLSGSKFVRNERELYGAQAHLETNAKTSQGQARASLDVFVAQPETQIGRDVFQSTGGSVFFLKRQDVTVGTESISVQVRDAQTGRVLNITPLAVGEDYRVNYFQGVVTLNAPLGDGDSGRLIESNAGGDTITNLVVQYEFTPTTSDTDTLAFGGRGEAWVTDKFRIGVTGISDETSLGDNHESYSADIRYQHSDTSFVQLDYAESRGPGYAQSYSQDGGFNVDNEVGSTGSGEAVNIEGQLDLNDVNPNMYAVVGGYYQTRTEGFATLDYQAATGTGDRTLYGAFINAQNGENLSWKLYADIEETTQGVNNATVGGELNGDLTDTLSVSVAAEQLTQATSSDENSRSSAKAKLTYSPSDALSYYIYSQNTINSNGLDAYNRYGAGVSAQLSDTWRMDAEVSDGTGGQSGRVFAAYEKEGNESYYFGYEVDSSRMASQSNSGSDNGKFILGGRRQVNENVSVFGENSYDIFGDRRTFSSNYGVDYQHNERMTYSFAARLGRVVDDATGQDFDRYAYSVGAQFAQQDVLAKGRIEYRRDTGVANGQGGNETYALSAQVKQKFSEQARVVASLDGIETRANNANIAKGTYVDGTIGYAFRPIDNDKLNMLLRYRFVYDMYGQTVDGQDNSGPRQKSHVFSIDADYDLNKNWTIGGKLGYRLAETSPDSQSDFSQNNAGLAIINARYHAVRDWDLLIENRVLWQEQTKSKQTSTLAAAYKHLGNNVKLGVGYNFGAFSDDLNDLVNDDDGVFVNLIAKF